MADKETLTSGREVVVERDENGEVKSIGIDVDGFGHGVTLTENEVYDLSAICDDDPDE
ncbi:MAG: hypothetical protein ACHQ1H_12235 [Nitrososphaerales archaeon]